jgi:hypothetical protein
MSDLYTDRWLCGVYTPRLIHTHTQTHHHTHTDTHTREERTYSYTDPMSRNIYIYSTFFIDIHVIPPVCLAEQ